MQASAPKTLTGPHVPEEAITPDFMRRLILGTAREIESRHLMLHLVRRSFRKILGLIREFAAHPDWLEDAPGKHSRSGPNCTDVLIELLSHSLGSAARSSIIGVPFGPRLVHHGTSLCSDDWWNRDAPSLPLDLPLLWARSLAWHVFWLLIHDGRPSPAA